MTQTIAVDIAIIGHGFSGTLALYHLVRGANTPLTISIIDSSPHTPRGVAYATTRPEHLLNVRASGMSAFPDIPDHFYRWLMSEQGKKACVDLGVEHRYTQDDFVPRYLFGCYLEDLEHETRTLAARNGITITHLRDRVSDITPNPEYIALSLTSSSTLTCEKLMLACGNTFETPTETHEHITTAPWFFDYTHLQQFADTGLPATIIGTGLTAVDTILSLLKAGWPNEIICVSRHGYFPLPHLPAGKHYTLLPDVDAFKNLRLSACIKEIRKQVRKAEAEGIPWQAVVDAYRPHIQTLWLQRLAKDQHRWAKKYFTLWNIHRHRMAPEIYAALQQAIASGKVSLLPGRGCESRAANTTVRTEIHTSHSTQILESALVFRCTGPKYQPIHVGMLGHMLRNKQLHMAANGLGIASLPGRPHRIYAEGKSVIYAIGTMLFGELLETTAVPELRGQTQHAATLCLSDVSQCHMQKSTG